MTTEDQDLTGNYDIHIPFKTKDGKRYKLIEISPIRALSDREADLLNNIYGILWMDAYYDAESDEIRKYAKRLVSMMSELNGTLKFKP